MAIDTGAYHSIIKELLPTNTTLVAVSKTKPAEDIQSLYALGQRDFGENYVQELVDKATNLPTDIRWHFIGHLQTNKVKYIAPFVHLIHGVDSLKLLTEINRQALRHGRIIDILLQVHIAREETKFGLDAEELRTLLQAVQAAPKDFSSVRIRGLMGMASFTDDENIVRNEFRFLKGLFAEQQAALKMDILSMGMSADYKIAIEEGSTLVRIGSLLFGKRSTVQNT